jgi:hypothetical protein
MLSKPYYEYETSRYIYRVGSLKAYYCLHEQRGCGFQLMFRQVERFVSDTPELFESAMAVLDILSYKPDCSVYIVRKAWIAHCSTKHVSLALTQAATSFCLIPPISNAKAQGGSLSDCKRA